MKSHLTRIVPICWAINQTFRHGYHLKDFKADLAAGFVVSLIALPLSMALAIAIGLPPQHGIYTAIIAGIAAAIFGGSFYQISGPTAAFVVVLIPIVAEFGLRGIIWCQIIAGIILIICGIAKLGKLINYVPYPVTTGFTTAIALSLAVISLKDFLGLKIENMGLHFVDKVVNLITHFPQINLLECGIGVTTLLSILWAKRYLRWAPAPAIGIITGSLLGWLLSYYDYSIATIGTEFKYTIDGILYSGIPSHAPLLQLPTFDKGNLLTFPSLIEFKAFLSPALIIAALAALESLLSASIADSLTGTRHQPNSELNGIGIANILSGLATGIPATAAIARTATNIHSGAKSPFSAVVHSLLILIYVLLLAPIICYIPMSALSALLILTAYNMSHLRQFSTIIKIAPIADRIVLLTCFTLTVFMDMVIGVTVGILLAVIFFLKRISHDTHIQIEASDPSLNQHNLLPKDTMMFKINGPLFFGTVEKAYDRTSIINDSIKTLIIDMEKVPFIDMSGMVAMKSVLSAMAKNRKIYLCGKDEVIQKIMKKLPLNLRNYVETSFSVNEVINLILSTAALQETEETLLVSK